MSSYWHLKLPEKKKCAYYFSRNIAQYVIFNFLCIFIGLFNSYCGRSFTGISRIGGDVSAITWGGTMLYWAQNSSALLNNAWGGWVLAPGIAIATLGASFALLNFSIDELTNPKLREV